MRRLLLPVLVLVALIVLATLLLAIPAGAAEREQSSARESDWSNLARLPGGVPLLVEDIDGTLHRGRFLAVTDDAISIGQRKRVLGITRYRVERIWLLGDKQIGKGAAIGATALGLVGALLGGIVGKSGGESGEASGMAISGGLTLAGIGAGIGALAAPPSKQLIYHALPSGPPSPTLPDRPDSRFSSLSGSCTNRLDSPTLLAAPFSDVCRVFSTEQVAREFVQSLERSSGRQDKDARAKEEVR